MRNSRCLLAGTARSCGDGRAWDGTEKPGPTVTRGARPEGGQRVNVTRCSFRESQLEPYTCTYVLAMLPPQSTQWPLP
ncbi:hypothetical protein GCM10010234_64190 [Streptomyces hawaiiensis]